MNIFINLFQYTSILTILLLPIQSNESRRDFQDVVLGAHKLSGFRAHKLSGCYNGITEVISPVGMGMPNYATRVSILPVGMGMPTYK